MDEYLERAQQLCQRNFVVDGHLDLPCDLYFRHLMGEKEVLKNRYLKDFRAAGLNLVVASIFLETTDLPFKGMQMALSQIAALYEELETVKDDMCLVRSATQIEEARRQGKIGVLLYMEGLDMITSDVQQLRCFYELGVRGAALTWSRRNYLAQGCCLQDPHRYVKGGLSDLGIQAVQMLEKLGMFVDVSHLNDDGFQDVAQTARKPFVATHSNARALYEHNRNITDAMIREISSRGGMIGLNAFCFADDVKDRTIGKLAEHIDYMVRLAGEDHVGLGLDLGYWYQRSCPQSLPDHPSPAQPDACIVFHREMPQIAAELLRRGMSESVVKKVMGENWKSYLEKIIG